MSTRNGRSYLDMSHKIMTPKNHQKGFNKFRNQEKIEKFKHSYSIPQFQLENINNSKKQIKRWMVRIRESFFTPEFNH